ncbi:Copia protein, partial [Mucuna pruriens]
LPDSKSLTIGLFTVLFFNILDDQIVAFVPLRITRTPSSLSLKTPELFSRGVPRLATHTTVKGDRFLYHTPKSPDLFTRGVFRLATHTTVKGDTFVYHIPKYRLVEFPGLKKPTSIIPLAETKIDVRNVFLNKIVEEEVYMQQSLGFEINKSLVYKLHRAIYSLNQVPRPWFERLTSALLLLGLSSSNVIMLVYEDNITVTGDNLPLLQDCIPKLNEQFALNELGNVDFFLGIEVQHLADG